MAPMTWTWLYEGKRLDWMAWRLKMGLRVDMDMHLRWLRQRA